MKIRYYNDILVEDDEEVSFEETQKLTTYTKAYFRDDEYLEKTELYSNCTLSTVNYYNINNQAYEDVKAFHFHNYQNVKFTVRQNLAKIQGYTWESIFFFSSLGELTNVTEILSNENQKPLMEIHMDKDYKVFELLKYYWEPDDELRYIFEYDGDGRNYTGYDLLYGDSAYLSEVKDYLPDPEFYDNGYHLPQAIANSTIPSV
ncbi:hypothetical protein NIES4074_01600 [Cylindrospermum sp. NIES-4074]|nr:hypothetical protein NIES4074_01600 [Cylindrospermum sp. NIES-4074]